METDPFLNDRMQPVLKQSLGFVPEASRADRLGPRSGHPLDAALAFLFKRKWMIAAGVIFLLVVSIGWVRSQKSGEIHPGDGTIHVADNSGATGGVKHEAGYDAPSAAPAIQRVAKPFGRSTSLFQAMRTAGLSDQEANAVIPSLSQLVNPKKCFPEHLLWTERDAQGRLMAFEYEPSNLYVIRAEKDPESRWSARKVTRPIKIDRLAKSAVVETTVANALETSGIPRSFASAFIEAFDNKIAFGSDTQCGDQMRIVVEKESVNGRFLRYHMPKALEWRSVKGQVLRAYWYVPSTSANNADGDYFDSQGRRNKGGWMRTPLHYDVISSRFDLKRKHPVLKRIMPHLGVDFAANTGTPVAAAADGTVAFVGNKGPNGNLISIRHAKGFETHYAHLSRFVRGLKAGMKVRQRQVIGYVGSTGRSTAPHLHFAVEKSGKMIDPLPLLHQSGEKLTEPALSQFRSMAKESDAELDRVPLKSAAELRCGKASQAPRASDM